MGTTLYDCIERNLIWLYRRIRIISFYLFEQGDSSIDLFAINASVKQHVKQNLIWLEVNIALKAHKQGKSLFKILSMVFILNTFEQSRVSVIVRVDFKFGHLLKEFPSLLDLITAHASIDQRVIGNGGRFDLIREHLVVDLESQVEFA